MILAKNKKTGVQQTFDNNTLFKFANSKNEYEIVKGGYLPEKKKKIEDIQFEIIEPDVQEFIFDTSKISTKDFNEMLELYTKEELEAFAQDNRKGISNKASKRLKNL